MPLYEYKTTGEGCDHCRDGFEEFQAMSAEPLTTCPMCGGEVRRLISPFCAAKNILSPSNLASKGFTQYRRRDSGSYEKTAGSGPKYLEAHD